MNCTCETPRPRFVLGKNTVCWNCEKEINICPAPDASDEKKKSSAIGVQPNNGLSQEESLTRLHLRFSKQTKQIEHCLLMLDDQKSQINELTRGMEYLAQQVKTLVDALAEDADPDQPITNYLSGKPV